MQIDEIIKRYNEKADVQFSGTVFFGNDDETLFAHSYGYANRSEKIKNTSNTRFGVASGCKIFTAIAICQLVDRGLLEFITSLNDLGMNIQGVDPGITIHHLLTHSSGISDYFDEEYMTDFANIWSKVPMYSMTSPDCFLPMFQNKPMKFAQGTRFSYSNSGFIILGLIVEKLTGLRFNAYVQEYIFQVCGMDDSGYFRMDQLPERTAMGYVGSDDEWKTNIYSVPVVGGPDGGAFTTSYDLVKFWQALMENKLLSKRLTEKMLYPHIKESEYIHYGYGVWIVMINNQIFKYFIMGSDPGVVMQSSFYPESKTQVHVLANIDKGAGIIASRIDEAIKNDNG